MIHRKFTEWGKRITIEEGEKYCPVCQGKGSKFASIKMNMYTVTEKIVCKYCKGHGKTDWIQNATGEPSVNDVPVKAIDLVKNNLGVFAAIWLREEIDKEILKSCLTTSGKAGHLMYYEMMKQFAKGVGVSVVTASQVNRKASSGVVPYVKGVGTKIGFLGLEASTQNIKNTLTSYLKRETQSRRRSKKARKKTTKK